MSTPSRSLRILRVLIVLFCVIFGASAGVSVMALRITGKPQVFRSIAKLVAGGHVVPSNDGKSKALTDFYGTIIETIESAEMKRRAYERVRALNPELKESEVQIRVVQTKSSGIINILATGSEPKYTQIFLNALLDEFLAYQQSIRGKTKGKDDYSDMSERVAIQERASSAAEHTEDWKFPILMGGSLGALAGLLVGLLISWLISALASSNTPPTPQSNS